MTEIKISYNNEEYTLEELLQKLSFSEKKIIELQDDKREMLYKIQDLEYELSKQVQLNVYIVRLLREKEE